MEQTALSNHATAYEKTLGEDFDLKMIIGGMGISPSVSEHPGLLGCHILGKEAFFQVWAPGADKVSVLVQAGKKWTHDGESKRYPLSKAPGGYWQGKFSDIQPNDIYLYEITSTFSDIDPAATKTVHSSSDRNEGSMNAAIVPRKISRFWHPFRTPWFHDFIIYQCHVGTFCGRNDGMNQETGAFRNVMDKLNYIRSMNFTAIQFLPVAQFSNYGKWGFNTSHYFTPEKSYGSPEDLTVLVDEAHKAGLAVIFEVAYAGGYNPTLWHFDIAKNDPVFFNGRQGNKGIAAAWQNPDVQEFFFQNAGMYFDQYNADGLAFAGTSEIRREDLAVVVGKLRERYPQKYFIADHASADPMMLSGRGFCAVSDPDSHRACYNALKGQDPVNNLLRVMDEQRFSHGWNLVKSLTGNCNDIGDRENGNAENGLNNPALRHGYLVDLLGGRNDWAARAKCRFAYALNTALAATPLMFMGSECLMANPYVGLGYWHDSVDANGDHRFNWSVAGDETAWQMRHLATDCNAVRLENEALKQDNLHVTQADRENGIVAFKRWAPNGNVILVVANPGDWNFYDCSYEVVTTQPGRWIQLLCTQDHKYGGWGSGNEFLCLSTSPDGRIRLNVPRFSVTMMKWVGW